MRENPCDACGRGYDCDFRHCIKYNEWFAERWQEVISGIIGKTRKPPKPTKKECDELSCEWWDRNSGGCVLCFGLDCIKNKLQNGGKIK